MAAPAPTFTPAAACLPTSPADVTRCQSRPNRPSFKPAPAPVGAGLYAVATLPLHLAPHWPCFTSRWLHLRPPCPADLQALLPAREHTPPQLTAHLLAHLPCLPHPGALSLCQQAAGWAEPAAGGAAAEGGKKKKKKKKGGASGGEDGAASSAPSTEVCVPACLRLLSGCRFGWGAGLPSAWLSCSPGMGCPRAVPQPASRLLWCFRRPPPPPTWPSLDLTPALLPAPQSS